MSKVLLELNVNANQFANILSCPRKHILQHFTRPQESLFENMGFSLFYASFGGNGTKNRLDVGHREAMIYGLIAWKIGRVVNYKIKICQFLPHFHEKCRSAQYFRVNIISECFLNRQWVEIFHLNLKIITGP